MKKGDGTYFVIFLFCFLLACESVEEEKYREFEQSVPLAAPEIIYPGELEVNPIAEFPPPKSILISTRPAPIQTEADHFFSMKNFNTADGLAMSSLLCGFKDSKGNLWFGTNGNGVSMYNGKSFITFSSGFGLIHNYIHNVTEDSAGNIWFGTYGGVSKYDGVHFHNYTTEDGLIDNDVHEILEDTRGNFWFATIKGISRYDPEEEQFVNYDNSSGLKNIYMDDIWRPGMESSGFREKEGSIFMIRLWMLPEKKLS